MMYPVEFIENLIFLFAFWLIIRYNTSAKLLNKFIVRTKKIGIQSYGYRITFEVFFFISINLGYLF